MKNILNKNHLTIKKIFNKILTEQRKVFRNMTGYQKLKRERDIIWGELEDWIYTYAKTKTEDKDEIEKFVAKEMGYIKYRIEDETK